MLGLRMTALATYILLEGVTHIRIANHRERDQQHTTDTHTAAVNLCVTESHVT